MEKMYLVEYDNGDTEMHSSLEGAQQEVKERTLQRYDYPVEGIIYECTPVVEFRPSMEFTPVEKDTYAAGKEIIV